MFSEDLGGGGVETNWTKCEKRQKNWKTLQPKSQKRPKEREQKILVDAKTDLQVCEDSRDIFWERREIWQLGVSAIKTLYENWDTFSFVFRFNAFSSTLLTRVWTDQFWMVSKTARTWADQINNTHFLKN
jgi:hypothetical protein